MWHHRLFTLGHEPHRSVSGGGGVEDTMLRGMGLLVTSLVISLLFS